MRTKDNIAEEHPTRQKRDIGKDTDAIKAIHDALKDIPRESQIKIIKAVCILLDIDLLENTIHSQGY